MYEYQLFGTHSSLIVLLIQPKLGLSHVNANDK